MARVLHLHDQQPDYQTQTALEQLTRESSSATCTIGPGGDLATPLLAVLKLHHHTESFDMIHAWGEPSLTIAAIRSAKKIIYSPTRFPNWRDRQWIRAIMSARDVQIVCPTDTMRRAYVERGVPIERCHLIRPGVEFVKVKARKDPALRQKLGFANGDFVILALGESLRGANHHSTLLAGSVLNVFEPVHKVLLWGRGPLAEAEIAYGRKMLPSNYLSIATDRLGPNVQFEELLPAADAIMISADAPIPTLSIAVCMAAGLPIIAVVSSTVSELLEDRHTCLMIGKCKTRLLATRLLDLREDPSLQWRICDAAKTEAYEYHSMTRFIDQFRTLYAQVSAGKTVDIPPVQPGAGTRFFGRA